MLKATRTVSSELVLEDLLRSLITVVTENAGAQRGVLLIRRRDELRIEAEAVAGGVPEVLQDTPVDEGEIAASIVRYVARAHTAVVLGDASRNPRFAQDPYVIVNKPRSLLCMPVLNQSHLVGVLYLENNLTTNAFTDERCVLLDMIAAQAAISINNAFLYDSLTRFVPNEFLAVLGRESILDVELGDAVDGEMTVLFSDIRSFTTRSSEMTPEDNFRFLNGYLRRVGPVIREHEGFIDKYIGDAVMALFTTGVEHAIRAAIRMHEEAALYSVDLEAAGQEPLRIGVGVHWGRMMLGTIGESRRMEGTVISDAVNTGSRLESMSKEMGVRIIVSGEALGQLADPAISASAASARGNFGRLSPGWLQQAGVAPVTVDRTGEARHRGELVTDIRGKRVLVIGGAGFIGSHVVDQLLERDVGSVLVYDDFTRGTRRNLEGALRDPRCRVFDVGGNILHTDILGAAMKEADMVVHLAALWLLQCHDYPASAFDVNVRGTFNVLEACRDNGIERLIYSSSASVYGNALETPMTEAHPFNNRTFYGATKIAGEAMCTAFGARYGLPWVGLRYMNVYGPRQDYKGVYIAVMMKILDRLDEGEQPVVYGDGSQSYDFVAVSDVARANLCALEADVTEGCYNVGTGKGTSIKAITDRILALTGSDQKIRLEPAGQTFVTHRVGSIDAAERDLGFRYDIELDDGLQRLIEWRRADRARG